MMRNQRIAILALVMAPILVTSSVAKAQGEPEGFTQTLPSDIKWNTFPAVPAGGQIGVMVGSPDKPAPYAARVRIPADMKVMPHTHPEDRVYTVVSGTWYIGFGDRFDADKLKAYSPGSVVFLPAKASHFHWAKSGEYVVQVNAVGPTAVDYVNPADDPRKK